MANDYEKNFLDIASKLDAVSKSYGSITKEANEFVQTKEEVLIRSLVKKIQAISVSDEYSKEVKQFARAFKDSLVKYCGYITVKNACNDEYNLKEDMRTLDELLNDLNALVGLDNVKQQINDLIAYQVVQKNVEIKGLTVQRLRFTWHF